MSVRLWLLALTGDRLDDLIHIGAVRIIRALHHRRWSLVKGRPVRVFWEDKRGPVIRLGGAQTCLSTLGKPGPKTYRAREPSYVRNRTPAVHFSR